MVYVLSKNGQPIMPTKNHAKVRLLLKSGKAKVVNRCPFTIQLTGISRGTSPRLKPWVSHAPTDMIIYIKGGAMQNENIQVQTLSLKKE